MFGLYECVNAHLSVKRKRSWLGRVRELISVFFDISNHRGAAPHFVPRNVDVVFNTLAIKVVGASVCKHGTEQLTGLFVGDLIDALRFRPSAIGDDYEKATI